MHAPPPSDLAAAFDTLDRHRTWELVDVQPLGFDAYHPQGMCLFDGRFYLSTADIDDRRGLLIAFGFDGQQLDRIDVTDGERFHPGGFTVLGDSAVVPTAEYRPDSTSVLSRVDLNTHVVEHLFRHDDHLGVAAELPAGGFVAGTWGTRQLIRFDPDGQQLAQVRFVSQFVDVQDMQLTSNTTAVCTGVIRIELPTGPTQLGGIAHLDLDTLRTTNEVPFTGFHQDRVAVCNPTWFVRNGSTIILYAVPNDRHSDLLTWTLELD